MKNPQDSTRRNIQAANKKIAKLEARIKEIAATVKALVKASKK